MADQSHEILNIADLEAAASVKLSKMAREYYNSGATEQFTLHENTAAFNKYRLCPRVLTDVSGVDTSTTVLGRKIPFPVCVAPTGLQKLAHPDGELANARACAKAGICMGISSFSNTGLEEVVSAGEGKMEFGLQLYILRDREVTRSLVTKAEGTWHTLCGYLLSFLGVY
jgi:(S)-2-hydroxy-acid oxidase